MAEKKPVKKKIKVIIQGAAATPAPPLGPALGQAGVAINDFVQKFNDLTKDRKGYPLPVKIVVYQDKTYDIFAKGPTIRHLIMDKIKLPKGSPKSNLEKKGSITKTQLLEIYEIKKADLSANDPEAGCKIIAGTCRSMGVTVEWDK